MIELSPIDHIEPAKSAKIGMLIASLTSISAGILLVITAILYVQANSFIICLGIALILVGLLLCKRSMQISIILFADHLEYRGYVHTRQIKRVSISRVSPAPLVIDYSSGSSRFGSSLEAAIFYAPGDEHAPGTLAERRAMAFSRIAAWSAK